MSEPSIGVVVPTLGGGIQLVRLLRSIQRQGDPPETIVVVSGGKLLDLTYCSTEFDCKILTDVGPGDRRSHARNLGAKAAGTQIVLFLDDDMEIAGNLIGECRRLMREGESALIIPEETRGAGLLGKVRQWERSLVEGDLFVCFPRALSYKLFVSAGGFDETLAGFEDLDLTATLIERGTSIKRTEARLIHHEENVTLNLYLSKRAHYVSGARIYKAKHPQIGAQVVSPVRRIRLYLRGIKKFTDIPYFFLAITLRAFELRQL